MQYKTRFIWFTNIKYINNNVIGIHKQGSEKYNFNKGTYLKYPINEYLNNINLIEKKEEKDKINEMSKDNLSKIEEIIENKIVQENKPKKEIKIIINLNNVRNRFLPIPESVSKGLEQEAKITDFIILKELGSNSSFGSVYAVKHKQTNAEYAIKAIDKRNKMNQEEKLYFKRGIEILYKINHPNVAKIFGHFEDNNYCYFIMEYMRIGNVYNLITNDKKKKFKQKFCASIIKDVISAIYYLHNMKPSIIHRNIKPENILISEEGLIAKITDFFVSNYIEEGEERTTKCGTPIYLAPEI